MVIVMSIKEAFELDKLEERLSGLYRQEEYERSRGFDEQDEYTHMICSQQRYIEKEIEETKKLYEEALDEASKRILIKLSKHFILDRDYIIDFCCDYTDDDYEMELLAEKVYDMACKFVKEMEK